MRFAMVFVLTLRVCVAFSAEESAPLPKVWKAENKDRIADALQVWRLGENYFHAGSEGDESLIRTGVITTAPKTERTFENYSAWTREFLIGPRLAPGVQFSCARGVCHEETVIRAALKSPSPELRLQALTLLMKVHSPSSIKEQWATLQELKKLDKGPLWKTLLSELESAFSAQAVEAELMNWNPPVSGLTEMDRYRNLTPYTAWMIRAAGLIQCRAVLPRIREWSTNIHLDSSLEAEWSLEQFQGPDAEAALAYCLKGWRYNASKHAANELNRRNPAFLAETLLAMGPPKDRLYEYALLLGQTGDARAVPMLCATVKDISIVDGSMFYFIETLARKEDVPLIKELPGQVRENQRARAEQVVKAVLKKYP